MEISKGQTWYNEHGSTMVISSYDMESGVFSGVYNSAVGDATKWYVLTGRADTAGKTVGWTVNWHNSHRNVHSATAWCGKLKVESGATVMPTTWILTYEPPPEDEWKSTVVGFDFFTLIQPTQETIAQAKCRCRKSHPNAA